MSNGSWCSLFRYCKTQHLGVFWPVSLKDLLLAQKAKESQKDIHYCFHSVKSLNMALLGPIKMHCRRVYTPNTQLLQLAFALQERTIEIPERNRFWGRKLPGEGVETEKERKSRI